MWITLPNSRAPSSFGISTKRQIIPYVWMNFWKTFFTPLLHTACFPIMPIPGWIFLIQSTVKDVGAVAGVAEKILGFRIHEVIILPEVLFLCIVRKLYTLYVHTAVSKIYWITCNLFVYRKADGISLRSVSMSPFCGWIVVLMHTISGSIRCSLALGCHLNYSSVEKW